MHSHSEISILSKNATVKKAMILSSIWIALGLSFSVVIYFCFGIDHCFQYISAYLVEKSLSIDNIFVFLMIFTNLSIEKEHQRKLLFIGIWSALILRVLMIFLVGELLSEFSFMLYIFGLFIIFLGVSSFYDSDKSKFQVGLLKFARNHLSLYDGDHNGRFVIKENGKYKITILVAAIVCIEICDIVFAFDSIPALFSITNDRTIIYTSNAFALIGMRSLYIAFVNMVDKFYYLKYSVGVVLVFIGFKMLLANYVHINSFVSLCIIVTILIFPIAIDKIRSIFLKQDIK